MTLTIRTATFDDLPEVRALLVATWHATYDTIYGAERVTEITDDRHALANLQRQLASPKWLRLVALFDGPIVGTANATIPAEDNIDLHQLYVSPEAQGRGIGSALLRATIAHWPYAGRVSLEVDPHNRAAIAFYHRLGFRKTGENPHAETGAGDMATLVFVKQLR